jgi:hypothetical protein
MNANANGPRYFLSYSGVSLPLRLVSPLAANELQNRNTYFRAVYDEADRLVSCEKLVYGEVELTHLYGRFYQPDIFAEIGDTKRPCLAFG